MTRLAPATAIFLSLAAGGLARADESLLPVGAVAPDVEGKDASGAPVRLSSELKKGHAAIVYFYPKDETLGCTKEACAFRDAFDKYVKAGVTIFAVSRDTEESHRGFREHQRLPFPMVADPSGAVQRAYRVPSINGGKAGGANNDLAARVSYLVAPDGKTGNGKTGNGKTGNGKTGNGKTGNGRIARVWPKVDPVVHASEVLDAALALKPATRVVKNGPKPGP
jgi:peroxiredoxin Q/BCP